MDVSFNRERIKADGMDLRSVAGDVPSASRRKPQAQSQMDAH